MFPLSRTAPYVAMNRKEIGIQGSVEGLPEGIIRASEALVYKRK